MNGARRVLRLMMLLSTEAAVLLAVGLTTALLLAVAVLALAVVYLGLFDGGDDDVADVQRFIELTEQARSLVPPDLPLLDSAKASVAIVPFQIKKDEARRALWASRRQRARLLAASSSRSPSSHRVRRGPLSRVDELTGAATDEFGEGGSSNQ
jgi:hypothetical protein